jgi:predicted  nucleic acid-binding Zn-ribbon protein
MGPTNLALVKLFEADQELREAQARLDAASKGVRIQERRTNDLAERIKLNQTQLREQQAKGGNLELDIKTRDAHIEKLRTQQQTAKNNKEYQAFLIEINTSKVDRGKVEEETLKVMEQVEKLQAELKDLTAQHETERTKLEQMKAQIGGTVKQLQSEIDQLKPARDQAAAAVPAKARIPFERLAERYDGEALSSVARPDRRREEYLCTACHMDLVTDVYNKLHSRDDLVFCPNCQRILFIPGDLPPEMAVNKKKERRETKPQEEDTAAAPAESSAASSDATNSATEVEQTASTDNSTSETASRPVQ